MDANQRKLNETLEKLMDRIESYHREKDSNVKQAAAVFAKLDTLVQSVSRLEAQESAEAKLASKIDEMTRHIDTIIKQQQKQEKQVEFEDTLRRVLHGAKITGKVIESVASSADVLFDSVSRMLKDGSNNTPGYRRADTTGENFDLSSFLKPLNSLIQGFASVGASSASSGYSAGSREKEVEKKSPDAELE
ncbi:hypothetical protein V6C27_12140 [Peptococcaceae bacterium 1198_IL3148]